MTSRAWEHGLEQSEIQVVLGVGEPGAGIHSHNSHTWARLRARPRPARMGNRKRKDISKKMGSIPRASKGRASGRGEAGLNPGSKHLQRNGNTRTQGDQDPGGPATG